jgi:hypothetical protein
MAMAKSSKIVKEELMKTMVLRLTTFMAVVLFAVGLAAQDDDVLNRDFNTGGGGGAGSCSTCYGNAWGLNGSMSLTCGSPQPGDWGSENCRIESYPEGTYCFLDGNDCCVD